MSRRNQPWWNDPADRRISNKFAGAEIAHALAEQGLHHLKVVGRGSHLVVYSEDNGYKINRVRFTWIAPQRYQLGFADHRGTWQGTPYEGSLSELITMLLEEFRFTLDEV
jgi:hypothetical protein